MSVHALQFTLHIILYLRSHLFRLKIINNQHYYANTKAIINNNKNTGLFLLVANFVIMYCIVINSIVVIQFKKHIMHS